MYREIERKFLVVREKLPDLSAQPGVAMIQGYLAYDPSIRVRVTVPGHGEPRAWITIKGPGAIDRAEYEYPVPHEDGMGLLELCLATLRKTRFHVPVGAHQWDLDRFSGAHEGLWLAEVELTAPDETFEHPSWLGAEVSLDPRFTNGALARAGRAP